MKLRTPFRAMAPALFLSALFTPENRAIGRPVVEVGFVVDTTGSMGALIDGARRKIWSIAAAIIDANPEAEIRIGLVAYRDIGGEYVTQTFDLTSDIQGLYADLLELRARGGGWPESINEAPDVGVTRQSWTYGPGTCRILFRIGDTPPRIDYARDRRYPAALALPQGSPSRPAIPSVA